MQYGEQLQNTEEEDSLAGTTLLNETTIRDESEATSMHPDKKGFMQSTKRIKDVVFGETQDVVVMIGTVVHTRQELKSLAAAQVS